MLSMEWIYKQNNIFVNFVATKSNLLYTFELLRLSNSDVAVFRILNCLH